MLGALMIHGIAPGPTMISENRELFWTVVGSFWVGNIMLLFLNIPLNRNLGHHPADSLQLPVPDRRLLHLRGCVYGEPKPVRRMGRSGVRLRRGFALRRMGYDPAPLLIGFVLGPLLEENFRRMMMVHDGDWLALFSSVPATVVSGALGVASCDGNANL